MPIPTNRAGQGLSAAPAADRRLRVLLLGIGLAALAYFLFLVWGPAGPAGLAGCFGLFYVGSRLWLRRARRRLRETFARLPEYERTAALAALDEVERAELLAALADGKGKR